jgi:hypothetical protein
VLRALGRVRDTRGQSAEALKLYERAARAADRAGDLPGRVSARGLASVRRSAIVHAAERRGDQDHQSRLVLPVVPR